MTPDDQRRCLWRGCAEEKFTELSEKDVSSLNSTITFDRAKFIKWLHNYFVTGFMQGAEFERTRNTPTQQLPYRDDSQPPEESP